MRLNLRAAFACAFLFGSSTTLAQWWDPTDMTPPYLKGTPQAPKVVYNHNKVQSARQAINAAIWNNDFARVERMYDEFLSQNIRATDGTWLVESVQVTFDQLFQAGLEPQMAKVMESWQKAIPDSKLRPVIEAVRWQRLAWNARGGASGSATPGEAMTLFKERLVKAAQALDAAGEAGRQSPIWYWVALIVAGSSGRPDAQFDALFEEAVARFPSYQPLYYTRVNYLLPQWGGDFRRVDAFVAQSVARTAGAEGESFYAWIYTDLMLKHPRRDRFFEDTKATWPHMKKALDDLSRRYPENKTLYLAYACHMRDRDTTARLIQELGPSAQVDPFFDGVTIDTCKRFALQPV